jgi:antitoxin FitA
MGSLVVRNIPDAVKERLKERAKKHGRSMEEEVRDILKRAAKDVDAPGAGVGTRFANRFRQIGPGEEPHIVELRDITIEPPNFENDHPRYKRRVRADARRA